MKKINLESEEERLAYRHTTSHILAQAVKRLYPEIKLAIDNGFYYDFNILQRFVEDEEELSPVQAKILPLVDKHHDYALKLKQLL